MRLPKSLDTKASEIQKGWQGPSRKRLRDEISQEFLTPKNKASDE